MAKKNNNNSDTSLVDAYESMLNKGDKKFSGILSPITVGWGYVAKPLGLTVSTTLSSARALDGFLRTHSDGWGLLQDSSMISILSSKGNMEIIKSFIKDFETTSEDDENADSDEDADEDEDKSKKALVNDMQLALLSVEALINSTGSELATSEYIDYLISTDSDKLSVDEQEVKENLVKLFT